ncbi:helix-turn-helix domain-containing protein [Streptomyces xanthochromogenes]|uniref:helix-turn-helix domain-containing protein n=1 Tax=Streptomyces xanthochromogenes TaxID=67384 RepID=UPI00342441F6
MSYSRIQRGQMAGDNFTQIANSLFRDPRLSAKAKGIFGFISTHRDGWGVTPESIAAAMKDGVASIKTGLRELERFGYLVRKQERRPDGTMEPIVYEITDMPSSEPVDENHPADPTRQNAAQSTTDGHNRRSEPVVDSPLAVDPPAVNRTHKKTSSKKTNSKNTSRPSVPAREERDAPNGGTDGSGDAERNPGLDLLLSIGAEKPEFLLTGKTLRDQALTVNGMLLQGWTEQQLHQVIAGQRLPDQVTTTVGGIVSGRLRKALLSPPPSSVPALPRQFRGNEPAEQRPTPMPSKYVHAQPADAVGVNAEQHALARQALRARKSAGPAR